MPQEAIRHTVETASLTTQPVVYSVAGLTFFGITFSDWVLIGTAALLGFNLLFAGVKAYGLFFNKNKDTEED